MPEPWFILTKRFGDDVRDPSSDVLLAAMQETIEPAFANDVEHPDSWVRYGYDDGPMYVLTYSRSGRLVLEQWADPDFEEELAPPCYLSDVSAEDATNIMRDLGEGGIDRIKEQPWQQGG